VNSVLETEGGFHRSCESFLHQPSVGVFRYDDAVESNGLLASCTVGESEDLNLLGREAGE
jgi:hypothetical protein